MLERLYLQNLRYPESQELQPTLIFICHSLGIKEPEKVNAFISMFVKSKYGKGISVPELSSELNIAIKKASNILDEFMEMGFIRSSRDKYILREGSLSMTLDAILDDIFMISRNLKRACVVIDRKATKNAVDKLLEEK